MKRFLLGGLLLLGQGAGLLALGAEKPEPAPAITPAAAEFFEKRVRPVLAEKCYACHGPQKQFGGLRLDSGAALRKGSDSGPVLVPGDPAKSKLIEAVRQSGGLKMPPAGKLPDQTIADLTQWVKMGAPWPGGAGTAAPAGMAERIAEARAKHWAFQPVRRPSLPKVKDAAWPTTPVDRFVLAKLEAKGIRPSPPADRVTLIRRVTYDLTGLPPTPAEVVEFVNDRSPNAYEKVVDRLLASPAYGERWGRHWLDVARYADTLGYLVGDAERRYPWAYTYRDYVIRSFNEDKPYDRFLQEQLAADQLELKDRRDLAALGFITVGNRFLGNQQEIIDDRIDVVSRGLQAMTVGCARCHDHKFDAIPTEDYYSLYGVFSACSEPGELPVIADAPDAKAADAYRAKHADLEKQLAQQKAAKAPNDQINKTEAALRQLESFDPGAPQRAMVVQDHGTPPNPHVFLRGNPGTPGKEIPRRFLAVAFGEERKPFVQGSGRLELARSITSPDNPLTARVIVNRVWGWHFGKPLVGTPSDFGVRGELPSNPELLDWLASVFEAPAGAEGSTSQRVNGKSGASTHLPVNSLSSGEAGLGWSFKKLHRLILLSRVYRESSTVLPEQAKADPENRLISHMNRQRLDLEEIRDGMLAVTGTLDQTPGGRAVDIIDAPFSNRRTVYGFLDRQNIPGLYRTWDFPDPNAHGAKRLETTVPQQTLYLMNNPFVQEQARKLVQRPGIAAQSSPEARIRQLYRVVYGRSPSPDEVDLGLSFLRRTEKESDGAVDVETSAWQYGYGEYDESAHHLKAFAPLPHFTGQAWQGGAMLPDATLGWVTLNAQGGHPGNDLKHSAIRRWVAPRDMTLSIHGSVHHPSDQGDGIRALVVSSRTGVAGEWVVHHGTAETRVERLDVRKGDAVDFVVECRTNNGFDSFTWAPGLQVVASSRPGQSAWEAAADFSGPAGAGPKPLTAWETYAQALLLSNEFLFID